jgi:ABC-type amino acid transport substrate-binding protein
VDLSQFNWGYFALGVSALLLLAWVMTLNARRPGLTAALVSLPHLLVAMLNTAAPARGLVDPQYVGYGFGLAAAQSGWMVTATAGAILILALAAAFAALNPGRLAGLVVLLASALFLALLGWPWLRSATGDMAGNAIQFGEYLTIPGPIATGLLFLLLIAPFLLGLLWGLRRLATGR